jgi:hypothetical protein
LFKQIQRAVDGFFEFRSESGPFSFVPGHGLRSLQRRGLVNPQPARHLPFDPRPHPLAERRPIDEISASRIYLCQSANDLGVPGFLGAGVNPAVKAYHQLMCQFGALSFGQA